MRLGHRYYDPGAGRFLSRDPIRDGYNWYAYCDNDPVNKVDPAGLYGFIVGPLLPFLPPPYFPVPPPEALEGPGFRMPEPIASVPRPNEPILSTPPVWPGPAPIPPKSAAERINEDPAFAIQPVKPVKPVKPGQPITGVDVGGGVTIGGGGKGELVPGKPPKYEVIGGIGFPF